MSTLKTAYVNKRRTICEILRDVYDLVEDGASARLVELLEEAYAAGKKMDTKLRQYKNGYDDGWYEETKEQELKLGLRKERENQLIKNGGT